MVQKESCMKKTVCGYCGVGCGLVIESGKLKGDKNYPVNRGLSCAKGTTSLEALEKGHRLLTPQMRGHREEFFSPATWDEALERIADAIRRSDPRRIGFYLSGQMLSEDYYVANKLGKGFIGTNNVDTNSRTCMSSAVVAYKKSIGIDYVPLRMEEIDQCNLLIIIGANPAEAHVVLSTKMKRARKRGCKIVVIDPRRTESAAFADLHLPLRVGSDIDLLNLVAQRLIREERIDESFIAEHVKGFERYKAGILALDSATLLAATGLSYTQFETFMHLFCESENVISAWTMGLNQSVQGVDKNLALINLHLLTGKINKPGNGPLSLTGQPNAMGGREVGGLATTLAVHLDFDDASTEKVGTFWGSDNISKTKGLTAFEMFEAAERHDLDVLIVCHTDPVYHLPNRHRIEKAIANIPLVVEINAYENSETAAFAHIRLPAAPWGEKSGTQTNLDRSVTLQRAIRPPSDQARADWEIFAALGKKLGFDEAFAYESVESVFDEYKEMTKLSEKGHLDLYKTRYEQLEKAPFVWGEGLMKGHKFMTEDGRAVLHFVVNKALSERPSDDYPFILLTGRTRDQWHSGTKTAAVEKLLRYKPLEYVEIHPHDAEKLGISDGDTVEVASRRGTISTTARITDTVQEKTLFLPVSDRRLNYLTNDLLDPESKEPDYNHSAATVRPIPTKETEAKD